jgi:predicted RNA methylase
LKKLCRGKVVADVGAGTGVLSIMAAESDAAKVYAIEYSQIYKRCKREVSKRDL